MLKKIGAYSAAFLLVAASVTVLYLTLTESSPSEPVSHNTRGPADSTAVKQYEKINSMPAGKVIDWGGLTTALLLAMGAYYKFDRSGDKFRTTQEREAIYNHIEAVGEKLTGDVKVVREEVREVRTAIQQVKRHNDEVFDRERVLRRIKSIEVDVLNGFVFDDDLRAFIIGISTRSQDFAHEVMDFTDNYNFEDLSYHRAKLLIVGKMSDCRMHAEHLGFTKPLIDAMDKVRCTSVNTLKGELKRLAADNITNHKFHRFEEIMATFAKAFFLGVVNVYNLEKLKTGGKNEKEQS